MDSEQKQVLKALQGKCSSEKAFKKVKITTEIYLYVGEDLAKVKEEFEELAWENNRKATQPNVYINEIQ